VNNISAGFTFGFAKDTQFYTFTFTAKKTNE